MHLEYWPQIQKLSMEQRGLLVSAIFSHINGEESPELDGATDMAFSFIMERIERDRAKYAEKCSKLRKNSKKGGEATKARYSQMASNGINESQIEGNPNPIRNPIPNTTLLDKESIKAGKPPAHKRGPYGYVKLTDDEYSKLISDIGEAEAARVIAYIDESAATTGNKNKWKNWNLVLRKAAREGWGKRAEREEKQNEPAKREYKGAGFYQRECGL